MNTDERDDGLNQHTHIEPWPSEWMAFQKAIPHADKECDRIMVFMDKRGLQGFTPNMYCQIVDGNETRIMAVRRRFFDLRFQGRAMYHPEGLMINNSQGNPVKAWVPGRDPRAGMQSKYQSALAEIALLKSEITRLNGLLAYRGKQRILDL